MLRSMLALPPFAICARHAVLPTSPGRAVCTPEEPEDGAEEGPEEAAEEGPEDGAAAAYGAAYHARSSSSSSSEIGAPPPFNQMCPCGVGPPTRACPVPVPETVIIIGSLSWQPMNIIIGSAVAGWDAVA